MKAIHQFGRGKNPGSRTDLEWEALAVMSGLSLAIIIKLFWSLGGALEALFHNVR